MKSAQPFTTTILVLSLLSLVSLGFGSGFLMQGEESMVGCPFAMGQMSMCPMTLNSHVAHWLGSLLAVAKSQIPLLLLAVLLVIALSRNLVLQIFSPPKQQIFSKLLSEHNPLGKSYNHFLDLFSSGILHPKVFSR